MSKVTIKLMTSRKSNMQFQLIPRSVTLSCYKFEFSQNFTDLGANNS